MKRTILIAALMALAAIAARAQGVPAVDIKDLNGKTVSTSTLGNDGKPYVISFWATWCKPCVKELTAIQDVYQDWQEETGVKLYAVSTDDTRGMSRVAPFVSSKGWDFEVLCDPNGDFKRAMNVVNVPHTFLIDGQGKVVWQHNSYVDGDEEELFEKIKSLK